MAISKGKESVAASFKRYIGISNCSVIAINPTKEEMKNILNIDVENEPEYTGERDVDGSPVKTARITFWLKPEDETIPAQSITFFINKAYRYSDKSGVKKIQVIDKYAANDKEKGIACRTAWPTIEEAKAHATLLTKNDGTKYQAQISGDYRPIYQGEEELINFIINYLCIPSVTAYNKDKQEWYTVSDPENSECRLDNIEAYFKGDFTEIKEAIALQPKNKIRVLFGIRTNNEGKQFQTAYTKLTLRANATNNNRLDTFIQNERLNGRLSDTEFEMCPLKEYVVNATEIKESEEPLPFEHTGDPEIDSLPFSI